MSDVMIYALAGVAAGTMIAYLLLALRAKTAGDYSGSAEIASLEKLLEDRDERLSKQEAALAEASKQLAGERAARTRAETRLEESVRGAAEQKKLLEDATARLSDTFKALSADALRNNNQSFIELSRKALDTVVEEMKGDLGRRQEAISGLVKPISDTLGKFDEQVRGIELKRKQEYTTLEEHIKSLGESNVSLRRETDRLVRALRRPHTRGSWGELTLRNTVELAGMEAHCDFVEQQSVSSESGALRPDMIVNLPSGRRIIVDAKTPMDAYLDMLDADTDEEKSAQRARHARIIREQVKSLALKEYWRQFDESPEFVVLFIPGESFLAAALDEDHALIEDGFRQKIVLATPTTLVALLKAVAYGWKQEAIAENARAISSLGRELYDRISTFASHFDGIRSGIIKTSDAYNKAVGSLERRVMPSARKFKELDTADGKDIDPLERIDAPLRRPGPGDADS